MSKKIEFEIWFRTKFGLAVDKRKCHLGETPERTFMNAWQSLPKRIDKFKDWIEWEQDEKEFHLSFDTFKETGFNFDLSVEIKSLEEC
jgi:hypothetical protein